jgi:RNA recognition motif-containing protein
MGFGFVNFDSNEAACSAMDAMNGTQLPQGKLMKISLARPAWKANIHSNVYVSGLPLTFHENDILSVFQAFAEKIENVRKLRDSRGIFRGIAVIRFDSEDVAQEATRVLNGYKLEEWATPIQIRPWRPEFRPERIDSSIASPSTPPYTGCGLTTPSPTGFNKLLTADRMNDSIISNASSDLTNQKVENWQEIWHKYVESQMKQIQPILLQSSKSMMQIPTPLATPTPSRLSRSYSAESSVPSLFVFHLPAETTESQLQALFEPFGSISSVRVLAGKGYGFVNYQKIDSAMASVNAMNGFKIGNKHLKVEFKKPVSPATAAPKIATGVLH